tara:strand:+ start:10764 stop:11069 length:306 start_codon:yes stop_codon:yes gene_type:complete
MDIPWGKLIGAGIGAGTGTPFLGATLGGVVDQMFGSKDKDKKPGADVHAKRAMTKRMLLHKPTLPPQHTQVGGTTQLRPTGIQSVPYFEQRKRAALQLARG